MKHFFKTVFPWIVVITFCYSVLFQALYNMMKFNVLWEYDNTKQMLLSMTCNFVPILCQAILTYVAIFKIDIFKSVPLKLIVDIVLSFGIMMLVDWSFILLTRLPLDWGGTAFNAIMVLLGIETAYFIQRYMRTCEKEAMAQRQIVEYQYEVLKAQVNPHFLFNSLNILNSLVAKKSDRSCDFIASLAAIYRYVLSSGDKRQVTVEEEMAFLNNYIEILKMRFGGIFTVEVNSHPKAMHRKIIPYTLQLLIENVSKHNLISDEYPMKVRIDIGDTEIRVMNTVRRRKTAPMTHVGLRYLTKLYESRGKEFRVIDDNETYTSIIPYI